MEKYVEVVFVKLHAPIIQTMMVFRMIVITVLTTVIHNSCMLMETEQAMFVTMLPVVVAVV